MTKNRPKLNCATFFEKFKNCYFFWFFRWRCLKNSSEGTKNNQKKISSCFREICEFMFKKSRKKINPRFWRNFLKKRTFRFFPANITKNVQKHIFKGSETTKKSYVVIFKIWAKRKKVDRPSHPSHPIIRQ